MNSSTKVSSLLEDLQALLRTPGDPALLTQGAIVVASLLLGWLGARLLLRTVKGGAEAPSGGWRSVVIPLIAFALMEVGRGALVRAGAATPLITLASILAFTYALVYLLMYALRRAFKPNALLRASERLIATTLWLAAVLHVFGILPRVREHLDSMSISIGAQEVSLLLVLRLFATVALTLLAAMWLSRFFEARIMAQSSVDLSLRAALAKILRTVLIMVAVLIALPLVGIDITALSVFGGAIGVGVGFGLQKIASNYVSGFIILLERSIRLGDLITVDERNGVVARINARYTVVRSLDGTESVIPNETFITQTVVNHSASDRRLLLKIPVQIGYRDNVEQAIHIMEGSARTQARVLHEPPPTAVLKGFGESGIDLELLVWIADPETGIAPLRSQILLTIWRDFGANKITIPYPQREVRLLTPAAEQQPGP